MKFEMHVEYAGVFLPVKDLLLQEEEWLTSHRQHLILAFSLLASGWAYFNTLDSGLPVMEDPSPQQMHNDCIPESIDKLEFHKYNASSSLSCTWFSLSKLLWILWKLPCMYSADLGRLGPGFGCGAGFGFGIGFGLIGGAGFGLGLPGMQFGFGFGAGFGVGVGFGYGLGKGWAYDEGGKHWNLPSLCAGSRDKKTAILGQLPFPTMRDITAMEKEDSGALWDQFICNSNIAFDFLEESGKRNKHA